MKNFNVFLKILLLLVAFLVPSKLFASENGIQPIDKNQLISVEDFRKTVKNILVDRVVGSSQVSSLASSVEDFLPDFQLASLLQGGDAFGGSDQVVFDLAQLLYSDIVKSNNIKLKAVFNRNSNLSPDAADFFGDEVGSMLSNQIGGTDDYEISFSYNYVNDQYGRNFNAYSKQFRKFSLDLISLEQTISAIETEGRSKIIELTSKYADEEARCNALADRSSDTLCLVNSLDVVQIEEEFTKEIAFLNRLSLEVGLNRFSDLVSNQPQIILSGKYRKRDPLVGQDEYSVQLKYEHGFANLNRFSAFSCPDIDGGNSSYEAILNFACYVNNKKTKSALDSSDRVFASIEYINVDDQNLSFNNQDFFKQGGDKIIASIGYGRDIHKGIFRNARIDISANWEEFIGDAEGQDRAIASLIYTKRLGKNISLPITFQIANKSEFLADDARQFGGHIGIKYDFSELKL